MGARRGGFRKRSSAPIYEGTGDIAVVRAKILSVDPVTWTCKVQSDNDNETHDGISVEPTYLDSEGGGQFSMPEENSIVWLCYPSKSQQPFIMGHSTLPKQEDEGDPNEEPVDRRMNRPVLNRGDKVLGSSATGYVIVRKGGVVEVAASEDCKRIYIPLTNLIREFAQNWEMNLGAGIISSLNRDNDASYGADKTPHEFQLRFNEFAEDGAPSIDLRMGRIKDEDDQMIPGGELGAVVCRFSINDRYTVWVDRAGNYATRINGVVTESYMGPRTTFHVASVRDVVKGTRNEDYQQRDAVVHTTDRLVVERDRNVEVRGNLDEKVAGQVNRQAGKVVETFKSVTRSIDGGVVEQITGGHSVTIGDNRSVGVAGDTSETVGRKKSTTVVKGYDISVYSDNFTVHDELGKLVFSSGGTSQSAALAKVTMKPTGAVVISSLGVVTMETNRTGCRIKTPKGEISVDAVGTVLLGPGPVRGGVITTLTMPVDPTTGIPTLGSASVQAGGPGIPGPGAIPSTFIPDPS
jgi:hypothetical protein